MVCLIEIVPYRVKLHPERPKEIQEPSKRIVLPCSLPLLFIWRRLGLRISFLEGGAGDVCNIHKFATSNKPAIFYFSEHIPQRLRLAPNVLFGGCKPAHDDSSFFGGELNED